MTRCKVAIGETNDDFLNWLEFYVSGFYEVIFEPTSLGWSDEELSIAEDCVRAALKVLGLSRGWFGFKADPDRLLRAVYDFGRKHSDVFLKTLANKKQFCIDKAADGGRAKAIAKTPDEMRKLVLAIERRIGDGKKRQTVERLYREGKIPISFPTFKRYRKKTK